MTLINCYKYGRVCLYMNVIIGKCFNYLLSQHKYPVRVLIVLVFFFRQNLAREKQLGKLID